FLCFSVSAQTPSSRCGSIEMTRGSPPRYIFWRCLRRPAMIDSRRGLLRLQRNMCSRFHASKLPADKPRRSLVHPRDRRADRELPLPRDDLPSAKTEYGTFHKARLQPPHLVDGFYWPL